MRNGLLLLVLSFFVPAFAQAQTYYNAPSSYSSSGSNTYYNAPAGGSTAPLNIKGMLRGDSSRSGAASSYNSRSKYISYGTDSSSYSLALSPQQVAANRTAFERHQAERQRVKDKQRQEAEAARLSSTQSETQKYLSQFQTTTSQGATATPRKRVIYNGNSNSSALPKRVFNTPY